MKANYLAKELRQNPLWKMRVVASKKAYRADYNTPQIRLVLEHSS